ncbi:MAG: flagellar motor switch protein FliM [Deltaproteobacteria bacterium]|nr:flagellar motor switch protein FliM [Deltaproteobacteria bacterium]MBW2019113.1 flagellar motor switch protein FliM [Deltaproteobacteria bacterium]MBW2073180.1 flagellar motor switch protein FliM [Deltaproteobacteria bacterium]RLB83800.1 MAG: flagellar motor switch protein FliM [Deltaproteobacteria bacterium]
MSQILSQDEVDSLLKGVTEGEVATETDTPVSSDDVIRYDFMDQDRVVDARMPTLDMINVRFCEIFRTTLSGIVRKIVDVSVESVGMIKFEKFHQSLPVPTSLHIFRMEPLRGQALLVLETRLVFNLIECYFGGKASEDVKIEGREYTPLENRMIQKVVRACFDDLAQAWRPIYEVTMSYVRSEMNPQFAGIALPNDSVTVTEFNVELDGQPGLMKLCIPYSTFEPIREKLRASGFQGDQFEVDVNWKKRLQGRIKDSMVNVMVELGTIQITGHGLLGLKVGDVIQLEQDVNERLVAKVEGVPKFKGRAGIIRGNKAIKIEQRCLGS